MCYNANSAGYPSHKKGQNYERQSMHGFPGLSRTSTVLPSGDPALERSTTSTYPEARNVGFLCALFTIIL